MQSIVSRRMRKLILSWCCFVLIHHIFAASSILIERWIRCNIAWRGIARCKCHVCGLFQLQVEEAWVAPVVDIDALAVFGHVHYGRPVTAHAGRFKRGIRVAYFQHVPASQRFSHWEGRWVFVRLRRILVRIVELLGVIRILSHLRKLDFASLGS